jgi:hypothetical protein
MSFVMPEVAVTRLIQYGINALRNDEKAFKEIFCYLSHNPLMAKEYGEEFSSRLWEWFNTDKIRVVQSWSLSMQTVPCYSVHLASEVEDESKASIGDFYGDVDEGELMVSPKTVMLDIGCHGSKSADQVLWLYYILQYILLKHKRVAEYLGLELHTQSASDWAKETGKLPEQIYTRWVRLRTTVLDTWLGDKSMCVEDLEVILEIEGKDHE